MHTIPCYIHKTLEYVFFLARIILLSLSSSRGQYVSRRVFAESGLTFSHTGRESAPVAHVALARRMYAHMAFVCYLRCARA